MNANMEVILESPLVVPAIMEIYQRVVLAVPDTVELVHLALLEAQYVGTSQGKSPFVAVGEFCEYLNHEVLHEYSNISNIPIATVRTLFENDIVNFVTQCSKFYRCQIKFRGLTKYLLENSRYLMLESLADVEGKPSYIVAVSKELTYEQLSKCNNPNRLSLESHLPSFP